MIRPPHGQPGIDAEIVREKAEALGRAGERGEPALAGVRAWNEASTPPATRARDGVS